MARTIKGADLSARPRQPRAVSQHLGCRTGVISDPNPFGLVCSFGYYTKCVSVVIGNAGNGKCLKTRFLSWKGELKCVIIHEGNLPYAGGFPCKQLHFGLFVDIQGNVYACPGSRDLLGNLRESSLKEILYVPLEPERGISPSGMKTPSTGTFHSWNREIYPRSVKA